MDSLVLIHSFREVAQRQSFSEAARVLGISKANVSKHIAALEARFGVRLLNRSTRSVSLTDAGALLLERSLPLLEMASSTNDELLGMAAQPSGRLRISISSALVDSEFTAQLIRFASLHPKVHMSLEYTNRRVDLVDEGVDLAIRGGRIADSDLIVRKLLLVNQVVVASPAYWQEHAMPQSPQDLSEHNCLIYSQDTASRQVQTQWVFENTPGKLVHLNVRGRMDTNDLRAVRRFALAGQGIAYLPRALVDEDILNGRLVTALQNHIPNDVWISAVYAQRRHNSAALKVLLEFLQQNITKSSA